jgi:hypothetical protein
MDKIIKSLDISKTSIPKVGENRAFTIRGTKGASFILQVVNSSNQFYNFSTKTFAASSHTPENNFKGTLQSTSLSGRIQFPSIGGAVTYNAIVIADPSTDTILNRKGGVINKSIGQVLDTVLSFQLLTDTSNYLTLPSATTLTSAPTKTGGASLVVNNTARNVSTDANGFGLIIARQPVESDLVFRNTQTVNGATSSSVTVVLDSVDDLVAHSTFVIGVSSGSLSGTPVIKAIDSKTKTLTLASAQSFADGITLTFEARGVKSINSAIGVGISAFSFEALPSSDGIVTKTVRTAPSSSTTINLNGTYGIAGGNIVTYSGDGVNSSVSNAVTSVSASEAAGSIVVQAAQTLEVGAVLAFTGSSSKIDVNYKLIISKVGNTNRTINLLLDNFITPGAAS